MNKKIKLSLLGALIAGSALAITLPIVSCSASSDEPHIDQPKIITAVSDDLIAAETLATTFLKTELEVGKTNDAQKNIVNSWKVGTELPIDQLNSIKEILNFNNTTTGGTVSGIEAIESITFNNGTIVPDAGLEINGPELKVNLKAQYTSSADILIQVNSLGIAPTNLITNQASLDAATQGITLSLLFQMQTKLNRTEQQNLLDSWKINDELTPTQLNTITNALKFEINGVEVLGVNAIKSVTFNSVATLPATGVNITGPELKINFRSEYSSSPDVFIQVGILGKAL
ncbi:MAG: hypothetical protein ACRC8C_01705 [Mycoplasmoidaceae bacterium]